MKEYQYAELEDKRNAIMTKYIIAVQVSLILSGTNFPVTSVKCFNFFFP